MVADRPLILSECRQRVWGRFNASVAAGSRDGSARKPLAQAVNSFRTIPVGCKRTPLGCVIREVVASEYGTGVAIRPRSGHTKAKKQEAKG